MKVAIISAIGFLTLAVALALWLIKKEKVE